MIAAPLVVGLLLATPPPPADLDRLFSRIQADLAKGRNHEALAGAERARAFARGAGLRREEGWALELLGGALYGRGEVKKALDAFQAALAASREARDERGVATALKDIGIAEKDLGELERALASLEDAASRFRRLGIAASLGSTRENMGMVYAAMGLPRRAYEVYEEVLAIARGAGDPELQAGVLIRMGHLAADPELSLTLFRAALEKSEESGQKGQAAWALQSVGEALQRAGRNDEAETVLRRVLDLWREQGNAPGEAAVLRDLAEMRVARDPEGARSSLAEALAKTGGLPRLRLSVRAGLAAALRELGRLDEAITELDTALSEVENVRARLEPEHRSAYFGQYQEVRAALVEALVRRSERDGRAEDVARAFETLEQARARETVEALDSPRAPSGDAPSILATARELLDGRTALLSYQVARAGSVVFVLTRNGLVVRRLAPEAELNPRVRNFVDLLAGGDEAGARATGLRLSRELVGPVLGHLAPGIDRLVVVPDGPLHALPFEALRGRAPDRILLQEFTLVYAPSAAIWSLHRRAGRVGPGSRADRRGVLVFADPAEPAPGSAAARTRRLYEQHGFHLGPLPFSAREGRAVARQAPRGTLLLLGPDASKATLREQDAGSFRILHFATHAIVDRQNPARSALVLASGPGRNEEGFLTAGEIARMRLPSELVVLSGCQTARGDFLPGEGPLSLSRAFFAAGARAVVATLWDVTDRGADELVVPFYRRLAEGEPPSAALRAVKLELRRKGARAATWAPFILLGGGDRPIPLGGSSGSRW